MPGKTIYEFDLQVVLDYVRTARQMFGDSEYGKSLNRYADRLSCGFTEDCPDVSPAQAGEVLLWAGTRLAAVAEMLGGGPELATVVNLVSSTGDDLIRSSEAKTSTEGQP